MSHYFANFLLIHQVQRNEGGLKDLSEAVPPWLWKLSSGAVGISRLQLGLVRYDARCAAIAECHQVDEVKDIRDRALALEMYAKQSLNEEAERGAREIRMLAERKTGELLQEAEENARGYGWRPPGR